MNVEKWLKNKKNRHILFFAMGVVLLYLYLKNKAKASNSTYTSLRAGYVTGTGLPASGGGSQTGSNGSDNVVSGSVTPKTYYSGWDKHCNVSRSGSSKDWRLTDTGTEALPAGHIWQYQVGGHVFRQETRMTNYPWKSNNPYRVIVTPVKIGAQSLNWWGSEGWQDPQLSAGFSDNVSFAVHYAYFNKAA